MDEEMALAFPSLSISCMGCNPLAESLRAILGPRWYDGGKALHDKDHEAQLDATHLVFPILIFPFCCFSASSSSFPFSP
jgi:hypothetical protein